MVTVRTFGLVAGLVASSLALPSKQEGPVLHKRQGAIPTLFGVSFTAAADVAPLPTIIDAAGDVIDAGADDDFNPCAVTLCEEHTTCNVVDGKAECIPDDLHGGNNLCLVTMCQEGHVCQLTDGKPVCYPVENTEPAAPLVTAIPVGTQCGRNRCPLGTVCCNASCGICTPPGGFCIMLWCGDWEKPALEASEGFEAPKAEEQS